MAMVTDWDQDGKLDVLTMIKDHQNSVRMLLNESKEIIQTYGYSAYGETFIMNQGRKNPVTNNVFYYTGRELEPETGDYYYRARYYDPSVGRFLSEDPLSSASGSTNFYKYVNNNPLTYFDPTGLILTYSCDKAEKEFADDIEKIRSTPDGARLLELLEKSPKIFVINLMSGLFRGAQWGNNVYIDPDFHPYIQTDYRPMAMSTTRVLAHELGHLTGIEDSGEGRMDNVREYENPIMSKLEEYVREQYGH